MSELWLKDQKVMVLSDEGGVPCHITEIVAPELLPVILANNPDDEKFQKWIGRRRIPEAREGRKKVTEAKGDILNPQKNYATLTDHYWIRWRTETWKKTNFFTNRYSSDIGDSFFLPWAVMKKKKLSDNSPDLTTGGVLKKRWKQKDDLSSYMVKAGSKLYNQEPLSEVMVSVLIETMGKIQSAGYNLHVEGTTMCCVSKNFIDMDTDLVTADQFYYETESRQGEETITHLLRACEQQDIPDAEEFIRWLTFTDIITGNSDRTLSNIGFIRNVKTMKYIGPAPAYDCGGAFWSKQALDPIQMIEIGKKNTSMQQSIFTDLIKQVDLQKVFQEANLRSMVASYPAFSQERQNQLDKTINKVYANLIKAEMVR